ncbi:hypothetical protein RhiirC2_798716 [Rhizophagus irregularis]|uniref:Uncharacterized protein n=1 Tax=Rhizophagus irregularis TaxID=588596 RepID=A0A2N1M616_9GLOM|nr:hypothetical protein RhiirC2_798716 [Rhizophagus irregularis]
MPNAANYRSYPKSEFCTANQLCRIEEDFIYDTKIDSRSGFDEDEDYGEETEEVLIDSQKNAAGDDLAE